MPLSLRSVRGHAHQQAITLTKCTIPTSAITTHAPRFVDCVELSLANATTIATLTSIDEWLSEELDAAISDLQLSPPPRSGTAPTLEQVEDDTLWAFLEAEAPTVLAQRSAMDPLFSDQDIGSLWKPPTRQATAAFALDVVASHLKQCPTNQHTFFTSTPSLSTFFDQRCAQFRSHNHTTDHDAATAPHHYLTEGEIVLRIKMAMSSRMKQSSTQPHRHAAIFEGSLAAVEAAEVVLTEAAVELLEAARHRSVMQNAAISESGNAVVALSLGL